MLGRLRLSIQDAIEVYLQFADKVFGSPQRLSRSRYSASSFEDVLKSVLERYCPNNPAGGASEKMVQEDCGATYERRCMT